MAEEKMELGEDNNRRRKDNCQPRENSNNQKRRKDDRRPRDDNGRSKKDDWRPGNSSSSTVLQMIKILMLNLSVNNGKGPKKVTVDTELH